MQTCVSRGPQSFLVNFLRLFFILIALALCQTMDQMQVEPSIQIHDRILRGGRLLQRGQVQVLQVRPTVGLYQRL